MHMNNSNVFRCNKPYPLYFMENVWMSPYPLNAISPTSKPKGKHTSLEELLPALQLPPKEF